MTNTEQFISQPQLRRICDHVIQQCPKALGMIFGNESAVDETLTVGMYPHDRDGAEGMYDAEMVEVFNDAMLLYASQKLAKNSKFLALKISEEEFVRDVAAKVEIGSPKSGLRVHIVHPQNQSRPVPKMFSEERDDIAKDVLDKFIKQQAKLYFKVFAELPDKKQGVQLS